MARPTLPTLNGPWLLRASAQQKEGDTHFRGAASQPSGTLQVSKANSNANRTLKQHGGRGLPLAPCGAAGHPLIQ